MRARTWMAAVGAATLLAAMGCGGEQTPAGTGGSDASSVADGQGSDALAGDVTAGDVAAGDVAAGDVAVGDGAAAADSATTDTVGLDADLSADGGGIDGGGADGGTNPPPSSAFCPVKDYKACGGDVTGKWLIRALCPDDPVKAAALCEHPYDDKPACAGAGNTATCTWQRGGSLDFKADGKVALALESALSIVWTFDPACLAVVKPDESTPADRCKAFNKPDKLACAWDGKICSCKGSASPGKEDTQGEWKITAGALSLGKPGKKPMSGTFCVSGDSLIWDVIPHPTSWRFWVMERKK